MDIHDLQARLREPLKTLVIKDGVLLEYDAGEQAIAAKLACYLAPLFPDYDVDVEYNRHGLDPKVVELGQECRGGGEKRVVPDIIVHRRGTDGANLLVIELKKETNIEPRDCDRAKIVAMKREFGYRFGVLIDVPAGTGETQVGAVEEWI